MFMQCSHLPPREHDRARVTRHTPHGSRRGRRGEPAQPAGAAAQVAGRRRLPSGSLGCACARAHRQLPLTPSSGHFSRTSCSERRVRTSRSENGRFPTFTLARRMHHQTHSPGRACTLRSQHQRRAPMSTPVLLYMLATGATGALGARACELLDPDEPFAVRAVHTHDDKWTGDIFFTRWPAGSVLELRWPKATTVLQVNHCDVLELFPIGVRVAVQDTGPDDGAFRVMIHVQGQQPSTPAITCYTASPPGCRRRLRARTQPSAPRG
mmetsp:Transcript_4087/g.6772  ORF Transcript_4087/g.6772 Transcript_4087/m.6772 type:complete len:267 (-) Transcript_4087:195-995(-)